MIAATATHIGFFVADGGWIAMFIATLFLPRRRSSPEQRSVIRELATGFRFIRGHRVLLMLMGFGWIGLLPAYVDQLGGGAREVGFVFSSAGIGALSGIVVAGRLSPRRHAGRLMLGAAAAFSATMLFVANSPSLWLGMGLAVVAHFGNGMFNISALVAVQLRVLDAIRGRVMRRVRNLAEDRAARGALDRRVGRGNWAQGRDDGGHGGSSRPYFHGIRNPEESSRTARRHCAGRVTVLGFAYSVYPDEYDP